MSRVLLLQLDGKIPNLALMRIAAHHRVRGDEVELRQCRKLEAAERRFFDEPDLVYASAIFTRSRPICERLQAVYPNILIGGTGWSETDTLEQHGILSKECDYSLYPAFRHSMGFTHRGCRLKCPFCVVPRKEGRWRAEGSIWDIWRGEPWPREVMLLDNDFFGDDSWRERMREIREGRFKVCWNQGINVRTLTDEQAEAIASVKFRDDQFKRPQLYCAWDNRKDEVKLFAGLERLARAGVRPKDIMVYVLIGYWKGPELNEDDLYRHQRLVDFGCQPYPMPFVRTRQLVGFQRWAVLRHDRVVPWERYEHANYRPEAIR
jgi:hypothetical protein